MWLAHVRDGTLAGGWALDDGVGAAVPRRAPRAGRQLAPRRWRAACGRDRGELVRKRVEVELLGEGPRAALGGFDEAVQELRRVNRMRRGTSRGR